MADSSAGTAAETQEVVRIGCAGLPSKVSRDDYFKHLDLLEVDATFFDPPADPALRRWRREAPPGAAFSTIAWQLVTHDAGTPGYERLAQPLAPEARSRVGSFRATDEVRGAWQRTVGAARALQAETILLQTPSSFSPSDRNREALRRFVGEVVGDERNELTLAWEPRGVWEPGRAAAFADELGLTYVCDPLQLEVPPPESDRAYFRLYGLGLYRNRISEDHLEVLAEFVEQYERVWVVFNNAEKYADAQRFRALWEGRAPEAE